MRILCLGDIHYPDRTVFDETLINKIKEEKPDLIICVGDYTDETVVEKIRNICKNTIFIKGESDYLDFPEYEEITVEGYKIGVFHGAYIKPEGDIEKLIRIIEERNLDILVTGHTHRPLLFTEDSKIIINPGSLTGAFSVSGVVSYMSYAVLDINGNNMTIEFKLKKLTK